MTNDFGSVVINTNSGAASFTVTNTGEAASGSITPVITGAAAADFTTTNGCTTLAGGGTCVVTVVFRPASAGVKNANLVVSGSPGGSAMATLIGTGQTPGTLTITPSSLAFGNQVNGTPTATQTFTVMNTGTVATSALTVTKAGTDPADFVKGTDTCNTMTLAGGASCMVSVTFNPTSAGPKAASFVISASTGGSVNGSVTGTGLDPARLSVVPGFQDFGSITTGTSSGNISFTVTNEGDVATSAITDSFTGANASEFSRVSTTCTTLAPNASCTIVVRFTPATVGSKMANLAVTAGTGGTATASLIGAAVAPGNLSISPTPFAFPNTTVGQTSTTQVFTVTNTGGSATGALGTALGGTDPANFTVVAGSNGCQGVVLAPAGTCTIVLSFAPTSGGLKSATLAVNHTGGSTTAAISGTGISPALFTLAPASRDFGSVVTTTTSAPQAFTLTNVGGQTSGVPSFAINGANASEFAVNATGCPAALAPNGACTVQVTFSPATAGAKTASLDVTGTGGPVSSALSGNGISNAALSVNPSIINFPLTLIGNSATVQNFTVTNNGSVDTGNLTITVIPAGEYTQTNNCTDGAGPGVDFLTPGASCVVSVTFSPTSPGLRSATVQVSGTPGGTVGTAVNGNALAKLEIETPVPVTYPINMYTFPNSIVDPDVAFTVQVTLRNNDTVDRAVTEAPTFGGNFALVSGACGTITAGGTCVVTYAYTPQTINTHTGNVVFTATGAGAGNTAQQNFTGTSNLQTLRITDIIAGQPDTTPSTPTSHDFGNRAVGTSSATRTFTVTNEGNMTTGVLAVDLAGAGFQIETNDCSGVSLADNASCDVVIVFTPTMQVAQMATITVRASQGAPLLGGTVTATVTGTGTASTPIAVPTMLDWGTLFAGDTAVANTDETFTVTNPNDVSTTLFFTINNGPSSYSRVLGGPNDCGANLGAGLSCVVTIRYLPSLSELGVRPPASVLVQMGTGSLSATVTLAATVRSSISIVTPPTAFTDVLVGTSASQTITVRNDSPTAVSGFVVTAPGPFSILNTTCTTLASLGTCTFDLVYSPTSAPSNDQTALQVNADNGIATAVVPANSITAANVTVSPGAFSFGSEIVGQNGASQVFTFKNIGQQTTTAFTAALSSSAHFSIQATTCGGTLAFNATCTVTVRFNPTIAGAQTADLTGIATNVAVSPVASLSGTGIAAGGLRVTPTAFTFADTTAGSNSANQTFTVQNTSGASPASLTLTTTSADFSVQPGGTCVSGVNTLAAGVSCTVLVRFNPATAGFKADQLTVQAGSTFADLYGRSLTVADVTSNAGGTFSNPTSFRGEAEDFSPHWTGNGTQSTAVNVTGVTGNVSNLIVRLNGLGTNSPDQANIVLESPTGRRLHLASNLNGGSVSGLNITIQDGLAVMNGFAPGTFAPSRNFDGNDWIGADSPQVVGTSTLTSTFGGEPANGTWRLYLASYCCSTGFFTELTGGWSLTVNSLAFDTQAIATTSATRTVQLTNNGETTATALTGTITGTDSTSFVITDGCNGVALAGGASCTVQVAFAPTTTGVKSALVNYTGPAAISVGMSGLGVFAPSLSITPSVVQNDGNRPIGELDTLETVFTVTNAAGTTTSNPISFSLSNAANYAFGPVGGADCLLDGTQVLATGASCTVGVLFNPTQLGVQAGNVVVMSNNTAMGLMTGTGTEALVRTSASPVVYTSAAPGSAGSSQVITFRNEADVSTTIVQTTLSNMAGSDFSITSDNCGGSSLSPNTSCTVTVQFVPSGATGARTATLQVQAVVTGTTTTATAALSSSIP